MIKNLLAVAEALTALAAAMEVEAITKGNLTLDGKERPAALNQENEPAPTAPSAPAPITFEEARAALAKIRSMGHSAEIKTLLQKHGADKLSAINPSEYAALLADAEAL